MHNMTGVIAKIKNIASCVPNVDFYIVNPDTESVDGNLIFVKQPGNNFCNKVFKYRNLSSIINIASYDLLVIRYVGADLSAIRLVSQFPGKIIFEHHTKEIAELKTRTLNPVLKWSQICNDYLLPRFMAKKLAGVCGVTQDILTYQQQRYCHNGLVYVVFPNGLDPSTARLSVPSAGGCTRFTFVASNFSDWHGFDRLLSSIRRYHAADRICVNIVGNTEMLKNDKTERFQGNIEVIYHDLLAKSELAALLAKTDIAIDSLGLHRLGFQDSSTLKSRDYLLAGVPMLRACPDSSLISTSPFTYMAANDDSDIDFSAVLVWYRDLDRSQMMATYKKVINEELGWRILFENLIAEMRVSGC